ncbi:MAG: LPS assembly protein LptD [Acidobacteriota bacterium]
MKRFLLGLLALGLASQPLTVDAQVDEAAAEASDAATAQAEADEDRIKFNYSLGGEGGGRATGTAGNIEYERDLYLIATGGVDFKYQSLRLQADRVRVDIPTNFLTAEGDVVLDEGAQRLAGTTIEYDLDTRTGRVTNAKAYLDGDYYIEGAQIAKTGDMTFTIDDGVLTSCEGEVPPWSIELSEASVTLEEYARIKNARLKFKKLPVFYSPYILWPANTERSSGFLVPKPGYSRRRGAELGLAYYKTLGRSADTTFVLDLSSEGFVGFGNEWRYRPSEGTSGLLRAYILREPDDADLDFFSNQFDDAMPGDERWKVEFLHESKDILGGFRGVVSLQEYSDLDYLQDYERDADVQSRSFIYSYAFLTKNFGPHSLNFLVDRRERLLAPLNTDIRHQLPEIEYQLRKYRIGQSQIYLDLAASMHYFSVDIGVPNPDDPTVEARARNQYGRVDIAPNLSIPLSSLPWLSAEVELGGRATHYTDSLNDTGTDFEGDSLNRTFPRAGFNIIGPSFSRIFDKKVGAFSKFKHIIEPRITYSYVGDFDEQQNIFRFDEIDNLTPANGFLFSLTNRIVAKPAAEEGEEDVGGAVEIASLVVSQGLSLDDDQPGQQSLVDPTIQTDEGPLGVALRVNPSETTSVRLDAGFNTLFDSLEIQSLRLSGSTMLGRHNFGLSWFSDWRVDLEADDLDPTTPMVPFDLRPVVSEKRSEQLRVFTKLALLPERLSLEAELSFDVEGREDALGNRDPWDLLQQRYFLNWTSQCYAWQLEYRESRFQEIPDRDIRFSLTLKNVGTFLDLNDSF